MKLNMPIEEIVYGHIIKELSKNQKPLGCAEPPAL